MLRYASIWDHGIQIGDYLRLDHWYSYFDWYSYLCLSSTVRVDWSESNQIVIGVMQRKHWYSCSETSLQSEPAYNFSLTYILGRMKTLVIRSNWMYLDMGNKYSLAFQLLPRCLSQGKWQAKAKCAKEWKHWHVHIVQVLIAWKAKTKCEEEWKQWPVQVLIAIRI